MQSCRCGTTYERPSAQTERFRPGLWPSVHRGYHLLDCLVVMKLPKGLTLEMIMAASERADCPGFCLACGSEQDGCEPDARNYRNYECEACGANMVFGAAEILIMMV